MSKLPQELTGTAAVAAEWRKLNRERGLLIDKGIAGTLTESEASRLAYLNGYADAHLRHVAPRPEMPTPEANHFLHPANMVPHVSEGEGREGIPHAYTSTACHHGLHARCRKACKFCGADCACSCHAPDADAATGIADDQIPAAAVPLMKITAGEVKPEGER